MSGQLDGNAKGKCARVVQKADQLCFRRGGGIFGPSPTLDPRVGRSGNGSPCAVQVSIPHQTALHAVYLQQYPNTD